MSNYETSASQSLSCSNCGYFFTLYRTESSTVIAGDWEVSLCSSSHQSPGIYVIRDRLQPQIEPVK